MEGVEGGVLAFLGEAAASRDRRDQAQEETRRHVQVAGRREDTKEQVVLAYGDWLPPHEAPRSDEASGHAAAVREGGVPRSACRRVLDVAHVLRVRRAVRQVQNGAPTAPLDARDET
ncbi:hypothetical protein BASA81_000716 [Batrachochytrium salamandrivorans]|nr:hypothetical protein BASA81_000716 [Batrachochytrium salamandrivorans]